MREGGTTGVAIRIHDGLTEGIRRYAQRTLRTGLRSGMQRPKRISANPSDKGSRPKRWRPGFPRPRSSSPSWAASEHAVVAKKSRYCNSRTNLKRENHNERKLGRC